MSKLISSYLSAEINRVRKEALRGNRVITTPQAVRYLFCDGVYFNKSEYSQLIKLSVMGGMCEVWLEPKRKKPSTVGELIEALGKLPRDLPLSEVKLKFPDLWVPAAI